MQSTRPQSLARRNARALRYIGPRRNVRLARCALALLVGIACLAASGFTMPDVPRAGLAFGIAGLICFAYLAATMPRD